MALIGLQMIERIYIGPNEEAVCGFGNFPGLNQEVGAGGATGSSYGYLLLGRIRGTLKREPLLNPLLALLKRDLIPIPYLADSCSSQFPRKDVAMGKLAQWKRTFVLWHSLERVAG